MVDVDVSGAVVGMSEANTSCCTAEGLVARMVYKTRSAGCRDPCINGMYRLLPEK